MVGSRRRIVGVDVTAHKEERNVTDTKKKIKLRVRYYVELVVGSPRESHTRLGFSGTFKALLHLHKAFVHIYLEKHGEVNSSNSSTGLPRESSSASSSSTSTSRSSLSSSSPKGLEKMLQGFRLRKMLHREASNSRSSMSSLDATEVIGIASFPAKSKLLVRLESQETKDDDKIATRTQALFEYYSQLFNSEEGELYVELIQRRSMEETHKDSDGGHERSDENNQQEAHNISGGGGFFKFLHSKSEHKSKAKAIEFLPPVHMNSSGKVKKGTRRSTERGATSKSNQRGH